MKEHDHGSSWPDAVEREGQLRCEKPDSSVFCAI